MSAKQVTLTILQDFTSDRAYTIGETVELDSLNADNLIARGFAVAGEAPAPEKPAKAKRKTKRGSGDDS